MQIRFVFYILLFEMSFSFSYASVNFADFQKDLSSEFENSLKHQILLKSESSTHLEFKSKDYESPWTLNADIRGMPASTVKDESVGAGMTTSLTFIKRDGFEVRTSNSFWQHSGVDYNHLVPLQGELTFGKDVTRGGSRSPLNIQADIDRSTNESRYLSSEVTYLNDLDSLQVLATKYFNTHCRISDLEDIQKSFSEITAAAKAKLSVKSMSRKDFLLLVDLANSIDVRKRDLIDTRADLEAAFFGFGAPITNLAKRLTNLGAVCTDPASFAIERDIKTGAVSDDFVKELPDVMLAQSVKERGVKELELLNKQTKLSLVPYLGVAYYTDQPASFNRAEGIVGVRLSYSFSGNDKSLEIKSAAEEVRRAILFKAQAEMENAKTIRGYYRQIDHAVSSMQIVKKRLEDVRALIEVIRVQLVIGLIEPTVSSQAYLGYFDVLKSARDLWETSVLSQLQLKILEQSRARVRTTLQKDFVPNPEKN